MCRELEYEDVWALFGEGRHPHIQRLFETKLAPFLSQSAIHFWQNRLWYFQNGLYYQGGMVRPLLSSEGEHCFIHMPSRLHGTQHVLCGSASVTAHLAGELSAACNYVCGHNSQLKPSCLSDCDKRSQYQFGSTWLQRGAALATALHALQ